MKRRGIGIDFGTTNSAVGVAENGQVRMATFAHADELKETFRSILYFDPANRDSKRKVRAITGPAAIERYLDAEGRGRLIQSLKSFLASRVFDATNVFGQRYTLEALIAVLLKGLKKDAEEQLGSLDGAIVIGRPVRFSGADSKADDEFALERLRGALEEAGFKDVGFEYELVAAAYFYESRLDHDELILIGDFGGGTSDFSLLRVGPGSKRDGARQPLTKGVALAGDAFDAKIIRHVVSPLLGLGTGYRSLGKTLPLPAWVYFKLERWHHLSFLKSKDTLHMLKSLKAESLEPKKLEALILVVENDLGYHLHGAVEKTKFTLSSAPVSGFRFRDYGILIETEVRRNDFEQWIEEELAQIAGCVDRLLKRAGADSAEVDKVFLTGGSSFVPAVRRIFETRFGADRIVTGGEFTSVAHGLALRAPV